MQLWLLTICKCKHYADIQNESSFMNFNSRRCDEDSLGGSGRFPSAEVEVGSHS